ncbi:transcription factor, putative [Medicago truncatula]|uniref:Transcription factor, putative n=1 Tax=Medicago truncatula TaxID=3880 RepID=G7KGH9_MEDTR|nr:transcription factor, putative [Medicago truncatula]
MFGVRIIDNVWPQILKLKNLSSLSASNKYLLYQRHELINNLSFLQYINSKCGLFNVADKLFHYSLQNGIGPKTYISCGISDNVGRGIMNDMVYFSILINTRHEK